MVGGNASSMIVFTMSLCYQYLTYVLTNIERNLNIRLLLISMCSPRECSTSTKSNHKKLGKKNTEKTLYFNQIGQNCFD